MQPIDELRVECKRLSRHTNFLSKRYSDAVARDLAACLRNWKQMSIVIDSLANSNGWDLKFTKVEVSKVVKKLQGNGITMSIPLPAAASTNNMQIAGVRVYDRALSAKEVKSLYEAERSSRPSMRKMEFRDWLNHAAYQVKHEGNSKDISREIFIDRTANLLGGTHPISNYIKDEHATWADPYIVELLNIRLGLWPVPYAILMESAQEILRVFGPYLR